MIRQITHLDKTLTVHLHDFAETVTSVINGSGHFFEKNFLEYVRINFAKQQTILDIGANIGNHSLFFSEFLEYDEIICFEPFAKNVELLKLNLSGKKCKIMDYALSDTNSTKPLYNSQSDNYGGFSLHSYGPNTSFVVENKITTKTLDSLELNNISMIKIDVEGHENCVLNGSIQTIKRNKPIIFIENLSHGYPTLFVESQFDEFFSSINYIKVAKNIEGSYMDLWSPL